MAFNWEILALWFMYFMVYSILGWAVETVYCSAIQRKIVERGFLNGPYCPIYGVGAVIVLLVLDPYINQPGLIFILGLILTTILEYLVSVIMEKLFHMRWWDYSQHRFNINGRVCLLNSTLFGFLCLILTLVIHPLVVNLLGKIPANWLYVTSAALLAVITLDAVLSVLATIKLDKHLAKIKEILEQLRENLEDLKEDLEDFKDDITEFKDEQNEKFREWLGEHGDAFDDMKDALEQWWSENKARRDKRNAKWEQLLSALKKPANYQERRLMRSFPNLAHNNAKLNEFLRELQDKVKKKVK